MKRESGRINYSIYAAALAATLCGQSALASSINNSTFTAVTAAALLLGYTISIAFRRLRYKARFLELIVVAAALTIYIEVIVGHSVADVLSPVSTGGTPELRLASMLLWLEVLRSFTLVSDEAVVFSAIPAVVLISLASTTSLMPELVPLFIIYLAMAVYLMAYRPQSDRRQFYRTSRTAIGLAAIALAIGGALALPVRYVSMKVFAVAMPGFTQLPYRFMTPGYAEDDFLRIAQGPVALSDATVLKIKAKSPTGRLPGRIYWKGRVFEHYTGHVWETNSTYRRKPSQFGQLPDKWDLHGQSVKPSRMLYQRVNVEIVRSNTMYAVGKPISVQSSVPVFKNDYGCLESTRGRASPGRYSITSVIPIEDPVKLRRAGIDRPLQKMYPRAIFQTFTQRPSTTARAGTLAREITKDLHNSYDKAQAIERYIGQNYLYNLDAAGTPSMVDPVDFFLFRSREGYCDVFASAMVMMCREIDIPARLVTGFAMGTRDDVTGEFLVKDKDSHAWVEVYFPNCGWVPFDPTSYTSDQNVFWLTQLIRQVRYSTAAIFSGPTIIPLALALMAVVAGMAFGSEVRVALRRRRTNLPTRLQMAVVNRYKALRRTLGVNDRNLSPRESVVAAGLSSEQSIRIAEQATELFEEIRYGTREILPEHLTELERLNRDLRRQLRTRRK